MKSKYVILGVVLFVVIVLTVILWPRQVPDVQVGDPSASADARTAAVGGEIAPSSVSGVVTDVDERPVEGATVSVGLLSATTDDTGSFTVPDVASGEHVITASVDGYIADGPLGARASARIEPGTSLDEVRLVLRKFGAISGTVTAAGKPVAARLSALYAGDTFAIDGIGSSSDDGTFTLKTVPPGRVRILAETDDYAVAESREVDLQDGEHVLDLEIDLAAAGVLAGKVLDTQGNSIEGAEVYAIGGTAARSSLVRTTRTGGFRFDNFPVGTDARVRVVASGFQEEVVEDVAVQRGEVTVVEVIVERVSGIVGSVVDARGPVAGAFVVRPGARERPLRSGTDGSFAVEAAPPVQLVAVSPRHASSPEVSADGSTSVELRLGAGGLIEGRVVASRGAPVQDFEIGVETFEVDGPAPYGTREIGVEQFLSSDGSFAFGPLRPGRYWLRASARGHAPGSSQVVQVSSNGTASGVQIALSSGGLVRGVVTDPSGNAVDGASVQLFDPLSPFQTATARTDASGTFVLRGVSPGRRSLRVGKRGYLTAVSSGIDVPAGGEATRNVVLGAKKPGDKYQFHGIGAVLRKRGDAIEIQELMDDKPAATFGLAKGDRILAIDGEATTDMRLDNVVELIRGEEGAAVEIEVEREGEGRFSVKVERGRVVVR